MLKSLEYINYLLNCNLNLDYTLNGKKVFYISEDILELFKQDLEIFEILLKYIKYEENYRDYCGHNDVYEYSRIILYYLNDNNIFNNKDKVVNDFNIVKNYILTNKVVDKN